MDDITEEPVFDTRSLRLVYRSVLLAVLLLLAAFTAGIYAVSVYGRPLVENMDKQIGERVAEQARRLAGAGLTNEALDTYRHALTLPFDDPTQKVWQSQEFLKLLLDEGRFDEAVLVANDTIVLDPNNGLPYSLLNKALRKAGHHAEAAVSAKEWAQWAAAHRQYDAQAWAEFYAGQSYLEMNDTEKALASFLAGYEASPSTENALAAARLLCEEKRYTEARPLLEFVVNHDQGAKRERARAMLSEAGS